MGRPPKQATKAKTVQMTFRMEITLKDKYERFAQEEELDLSDLARRALREYADRRENAERKVS
jgi:predicted transcriptional regulator